MFKQFLFFMTLILSLEACQSKTNTESEEINTLLENWHLAASHADLDADFSVFADNAIYIGTDASERWTKPEFFSFCEPHFKKGKAWDFKAYDRQIYFSEDGKTAWFDELLNTWMGVCRASGVLIYKDNSWKLSHYQLSVTVKNKKMKQFLEIQ